MKEMIASVSVDTWILVLVAIMNGVILYFTRKIERNTNSVVDELITKAKAEAKLEAIEKGEVRVRR